MQAAEAQAGRVDHGARQRRHDALVGGAHAAALLPAVYLYEHGQLDGADRCISVAAAVDVYNLGRVAQGLRRAQGMSTGRAQRAGGAGLVAARAPARRAHYR